nr:MAG: hypothetical protein [Bacteriophage sp.]
MKLDRALMHLNNIQHLNRELNLAINLAVKDGILVNVDTETLEKIGENPTPFITVSIFVEPDKLEP